MSVVRSDELSLLGLHTGSLAAFYAQRPTEIRAVHIRRAERALLSLEEFADKGLADEARQWLQAKDAFAFLKQRLTEYEKLKSVRDRHQSEIDELTGTLWKWNALQDVERQKLLQNYQRSKLFVEQNLNVAESHILHKYARYKAMNRLLPHADNAEHLCDAIFHCQNRLKYEENIAKIEQRRENAAERLASVRRGFNLALFMCIFVVSLPLCLPVAFSLWNRRREIENQLANMNESQKREERRLQIADEGVIASEEIKDILGDVPLETIRRTLDELRELRSEFQRVDKNPSITASLVSFVDLYKPRLRELFGEVPEDMAKAFVWFKEEVERVLNVEAEHGKQVERLEEINSALRRLVKGHSETILRDSFERMRCVAENNFQIEIDESYKAELAKSVCNLPSLLQSSRILLSQVSHGHIVDLSVWQDVHRWLLSSSAQFQAMELELRLVSSVDSEYKNSFELEQAIS
jgi:transcriptional regulator of met regulon